MRRNFDVIIEQVNGCYCASLAILPRVCAEADSRELVLQQLRQVADEYFARVEFTTIDLSESTTTYRPGSPQAVLAAMRASTMDTEDELYQEYLANLAVAKKRDRFACRFRRM